MLTYCFTYVVLKLYVYHDNNVRLIYHCDIEQRLLPNTARKKELYGSKTCLILILIALEVSSQVNCYKHFNFTPLA